MIKSILQKINKLSPIKLKQTYLLFIISVIVVFFLVKKVKESFLNEENSTKFTNDEIKNLKDIASWFQKRNNRLEFVIPNNRRLRANRVRADTISAEIVNANKVQSLFM